MTKAKKSARERGKPTNLYMREADITKLRELTAYLAGEGVRTSNSLIARAAIHAATPDRAFLKAYRQVAEADLRFRRE
jgi:hypothetical protein